MEEISWRQKSRAARLKEGNKNTRFFHRIACMRKSSNSISKLRVDGVWVDDPVLITNHIEHYFHQLYLEPFLSRPEIEGVDFDRIDEEHQRWLKRPFSKDEVKNALNSLEDNKAPEPDGFLLKSLKFVGT